MNNKNKPTERGKRLKNLRGIANLSRQEMSQITDINIHTLKSWELGKFKGITADGAKKITRKISIEKNINCSIEWIMEGEGEFPYFNRDQDKNITIDISPEDEKKLFIQSSEENKLFSYKKQETIPIYIKIDEVGYTPYYGNIDALSGIHILVELNNGNIVLDRLLTEQDDSLLLSNEKNDVIKIFKHDIKQINIIKRIYCNKSI